MSASCPKASDPHSLNHAALRTFPRPRENIGSHFSSQGRWFDPSTAHRIREKPRLRAANDSEHPRDPEDPHYTENPEVAVGTRAPRSAGSTRDTPSSCHTDSVGSTRSQQPHLRKRPVARIERHVMLALAGTTASNEPHNACAPPAACSQNASTRAVLPMPASPRRVPGGPAHADSQATGPPVGRESAPAAAGSSNDRTSAPVCGGTGAPQIQHGSPKRRSEMRLMSVGKIDNAGQVRDGYIRSGTRGHGERRSRGKRSAPSLC